MSVLTLTLNGAPVAVAAGSTLLEACRKRVILNLCRQPLLQVQRILQPQPQRLLPRYVGPAFQRLLQALLHGPRRDIAIAGQPQGLFLSVAQVHGWIAASAGI
jgi:hypothetical protein